MAASRSGSPSGVPRGGSPLVCDSRFGQRAGSNGFTRSRQQLAGGRDLASQTLSGSVLAKTFGEANVDLEPGSRSLDAGFFPCCVE